MYSNEFRRRSMLEEFKFLDTIEKLGERHRETYDKVKSEMMKKDEAKHPGKSVAFVGVNPPCGQYSLKELYDHCVKKYPYPGFLMCVEQNTPGGIRPHLHIAHPVSDNTRKNHIITRVAKLFQVEQNSVDVNVSKSSIVVSRWVKYIHGEKKDEKKENVEKDIKDRQYYNIPNIYENGVLTWSSETGSH